ncbi:MAG: 2-hydroxyacyl-CoA dehydratase [Deltaproteobacteria bacterium]|nr:2-hydroxyacyl-CoA dehydratase [Deltaproteobacteria bacterium]
MTLDIQIPKRSDVMEAHKKDGGLVAAVFPIHYPRALLRAHGILPVEAWGPPKADTTLGDAHLQSYTCSLVRHGLSYLLAGGFDGVDLFLVPHCCDSLQGLGSLLNDFILRKAPAFNLYLPRDRRQIDIDFLAKEIAALSARLEGLTKKTLDDESLTAAIDEEEKATAAVGRLFKKRRNLGCTNREFYTLVRAREYLPAEQFTTLVEQVLAGARETTNDDIPIVVSGVVPEPMDILDSLTDMGTIIVADDYLSMGRRQYKTTERIDPFTKMAEAIVLGPPDSTRGSSFSDRLDHLLNLVRTSEACGVVFHQIKFCEPEQFYLPALKKGLEDAQVPTLVIEVDIGDPLASQVVTRLEAFVEMIS